MPNNDSLNSDFKFEIRKIRLNKNDYKDNKVEKFLYKHLSKDEKFFSQLDKEDGTTGFITSKDIDIFLEQKDIKKQNISKEDIIDFLTKVKKLNPTKLESAYSDIQFVDENNNNLINDDVSEYFGLNLSFPL